MPTLILRTTSIKVTTIAKDGTVSTRSHTESKVLVKVKTTARVEKELVTT
jgi:hypothetical protein